MKSRVLMTALVATLLLGARAYAADCNACDPACDPCSACRAKSCDLFSGLKKLAACSPCKETGSGPCDGVVACSPCDEAACDPCGACGDDGCASSCRSTSFGKRLRGIFASKGCDPCGAAECKPCDVADCGSPCDEAGSCDSGKGSRLSLRKFFDGFKLAGRCSGGCSDPCGPCDANCGPCDDAGDNGCSPCDADQGCGQKFGRLFDSPRRGVKSLFSGLFAGKCDPCGPCGACDNVACDPCTSCL